LRDIVCKKGADMHTHPHLIKQTLVPRLINEINKRTQSNSEKLNIMSYIKNKTEPKHKITIGKKRTMLRMFMP
ncbi:hypothetical protein ACSLOG_27575, partial [Escherichia coli]